MEKEPQLSDRAIGAVFSTMVIGRVFGAAISPLLFAHLPVLLIIMSPFLINLVAVSPLLSPAVYFPVAIFITTMQALIGFYFGNILGSRALEWLLERIPFPPTITEKLLALVRRASVVTIFIIPGPILGTIAGVAGVKRRTFHWLVAPAQTIWVTAAYFVGEALLEYIEIARNYVIEHAFMLTSITVGLVAIRLIYGRFMKDRAKKIARRVMEKVRS